MTNVMQQYPGASLETIVFFASRETIVNESMILRVKEVINYPTMEEILFEIADIFEITPHDIKKQDRHKEIVVIRNIYFFVAKSMTKQSLKSIGEFMDGRDHTTVIHGIASLQNNFKTKDWFFLSYWTRYLMETKIFK